MAESVLLGRSDFPHGVHEVYCGSLVYLDGPLIVRTVGRVDDGRSNGTKPKRERCRL